MYGCECMESRFIGLLDRGSPSLLNLELDHGFKIEVFSLEEISPTVKVLEGPGLWDYDQRDRRWLENLAGKDGSIYAITHSTSIEHKTAAFDDFYKVWYPFLENVLAALRLFKEGRLFMPFSYSYLWDNDRITFHGSQVDFRKPSQVSEYSLDISEIKEANRIIKTLKLPFEMPFLRLAHSTFEHSYFIDEPEICFLWLMVGMETIFNRGDQEITRTISRNVAVLLGSHLEECLRIQKEFRTLYKQRSKLVHGKLDNKIDIGVVLSLRDYVRRSIRKTHELNIDRDRLLDILDASGFGCGLIHNSKK